MAGLIVLGFLYAEPAAAQQYRGHLHGRILTAERDAAAGVSMRITSEATGETRRFTSDDEGRYAVTDLLPGSYLIEGDGGRAGSFRVRTSVTIDQALELDLELGVVPFAMDADVRPAFIPIDRSTARVGSRLDVSFLTRLPLDGRRFLETLTLARGVAPSGTSVTINGTPATFTSYLLDGVYDTDPRLGGPAARPQLDSLEVIQVTGSAFDATFGRSAGGQVNVITRAGSTRASGGALGLYLPEADQLQVGVFGGGPVAADRTFAFGNYQHTRSDDRRLEEAAGRHLLGGRADHLLGSSTRLAARYALDDRGLLGRRGQNAGISLHSAPAGALTNEVRAGWTRVAFAPLAGSIESETYQLADSVTWWRGGHLVRGGAEWYGFERGLSSGETAARNWGVYVEDNWRLLPAVSVSGGVRYDRASGPREDSAEGKVSPQAGFAWTVDREAQTVLRGGYGLRHQVATADTGIPRVHHWTLGLQRQLGRARAFDAAYVATRGDELDGGAAGSHYNALQLGFEQRSETGLTATVAYTYGRWTERDTGRQEYERSPLDSRHRLTAAFVASLPFGAERRWFSDGLAAAILGEIELTGIFTRRTGRPAGSEDLESSGQAAIDLGVLKTVRLGARRTLQLRLETFNATDHEAARRGRRCQFGGRIGF
jgi:hypothetical protein